MARRAGSDEIAPPLSAAKGGDHCIGCCLAGKANPPRATCRGNCEACDRALRRAIDAKKISEAQALADGLWLPPGKPGRKPTAGMHSAIEQSQQEK